MQPPFNQNTRSRLGAALVVDDDELFRAGLVEMLRSDFKFMEVIEVRTLEEALRVLGKRPDISFLSLELSISESPELMLRTLRETFPSVFIVVVTRSRRHEDMLLAVTAGVRGYLLKWWSASEIAAAVTRVLEGAIALPASVAKPSAQSSPPAGSVSKAAEKAEVRLTPRQQHVLQLLRRGKSNKQIARELRISPSTVNSHTVAIYRALGVRNRASVAAAPLPTPSSKQLS